MAIAPKVTPKAVAPAPSMQLSNADAKALAGGAIWSEMGNLDKIKAALGHATETVVSTGKYVDLIVRITP